ncbi:unnamed protein product [Thelazia callipaeda]|uniref:Protein kinase domain-containing protein n=1 Tax=Thelazia callipaeda TaxID=103827 RepID=A0A158RCY6_THECL|nr:unnamed protein product [Thelazia callipaeda]
MPILDVFDTIWFRLQRLDLYRLYGSVEGDVWVEMGNAIIALNNPVKFGEEISKSSDIYRLWSNVRQCLGCKGHKCTVFIRQFAPTDSAENFHFYENGLKILRQLRHPHITKYIDCAVNKHEIWLLTERIQILDLAISNLSPIEIHSGLTHILSALIFLHNKAYICHNNVCPYSIYVTSDGQWKLGGFECAQKLVNSKHWVQTDFVHSIKIAEFAPVEDKPMLQMMVSVDIPPTARDVFAFGKLIFYALPYLEKHLMTETVDCLQRVAHRLTENDAHKRGELSGLPTSYPEAFSNHLTVAVDFLQNIHAKSCAEKQDFFATIVSQLKALPEEVIGRRLVPLLLSRHILLDSVAQEKLIPIVLQPTGILIASIEYLIFPYTCLILQSHNVLLMNTFYVHLKIFEVSNEGKDGLLCESSFQKWIIPELVKIFAVHETAVRLALLSYFHLYMRYFSRSQLEMVLYELSLGMQDKQDKIVSASLHSMAHLVEVIGGEAVTGLTRKKIFANGRPKVCFILMISSIIIL